MARTDKPKQPKTTSDAPIKPTRKREIELTEDELDKISGGPTAVEIKNNGIIAVL
jgi:bacteriocin-like protein